MKITRSESRNIVNYARNLVAERLIIERRGWDIMVNNKQDELISSMGRELLSGYRSMMISISSIDWLSTDAVSLDSLDGLVLVDEMKALIGTLTRYLILELTSDELTDLMGHVVNSIMVWCVNTDRDFLVKDETGEGLVILDRAVTGHWSEAHELIMEALQNDLQYITMILLSDLHHLTYVASADQCAEILS